MSDQTASGLSRATSNASDMVFTPRDRDILRRLASRVAELAARPIEQEKRDLWYRHNALEPTRPLVFCDPENGWNEIITQDGLECEGGLARAWEMALRKEIFWGAEMLDDRVIEPFFNVGYACTETDWGMHQTQIGGGAGGAYTWESPLKTYADLDKLHFRQIIIDHAATQAVVDQANDLLGDLLTVRAKAAWWWSLGMTWHFVNIRGLEKMMFDMVDEPEGMHALMAFLRDEHLARIDFLEANDLLSLNNDGTYVGSGGFGWTRDLPQPDFAGSARAKDMWGFCESQETIGVSPDMFEEFVFQYQLPIMERFGLNCYGCCEPVDGRWRIIKKAPRLRRVSVSAWCQLPRTAEMLGSDYIFSWKPNPADLAAPTFDSDRIRRDIRAALEITRDCRVEVVMKDNHTICNDPSRVKDWTRIVREEAERV